MKAGKAAEERAPYGVMESPVRKARGVAALPEETYVSLQGVSYGTYLRMLQETGDERHARFTYNREVLEIMSPGRQHEQATRIFDTMVKVIAEEMNLPIIGAGSLTCKNDAVQKGMEPDACFYIGDLRRVQDAAADDVIPDLFIEVDISRSSLQKNEILLALGVGEWWRYDGVVLEIRTLVSGSYSLSDRSSFFPKLDLIGVIARFMQQRESDPMGDTGMLRSFRAWVREELAK